MLKYGFPLCFPHNNEKDLESGEINHSSAMKYPAYVETYLTTEMSHKAIYGHFRICLFSLVLVHYCQSSILMWYCLMMHCKYVLTL